MLSVQIDEFQSHGPELLYGGRRVVDERTTLSLRYLSPENQLGVVVKISFIQEGADFGHIRHIKYTLNNGFSSARANRIRLSTLTKNQL